MAEAQQPQRRGDEYNWIIPIEVMFSSINHREVQACSISTVSDKLRSPKEEAYSPKAVSIGPLHNGTRINLQLMEELKWRYFLSLLGRNVMPEEHTRRLRDCAVSMLELDNVVRATYGGTIKFEPQDLAKIMMVDGCFVLEFLFRLKNYMEGRELGDNSFDDPIFENEERLFAVLKDLIMLENQVPFIILKQLYRKIFPRDIAIDEDHRVADLALAAFGYNSVHRSGIAHLLHLVHMSTINPENKQVKRASQELKRCATRLRAAGITIRPADSNMQSNSKFVDKFDFDINLQEGMLEIPPLHIKETTEVNWRNMIAWEQSRIGIKSKFTSYALFFQGLICCEHDIELLLGNEVIINDSRKSKEDLLTLFGTIADGVEHMDSSYSDLCQNLNGNRPAEVLKKMAIITWHKCRFILAIIRYYWLNWYNILISEHVPTVWKLIGVLAATLLLALTITQTYYAANSHN